MITLGVDIGFDTLKVIGLKKTGRRYHLSGMNVAGVPAGSWSADELKNVDSLAAALKNALTGAKPSRIVAKQAMIALPESAIFSGTFPLPALSEKELAKALPFEVAEKLSINLEDYIIDYESTTSSLPLGPVAGEPVAGKDPEKPKDPKAKGADQPAAPGAPSADGQKMIFATAAKKTLIQSIISLFEAVDIELAGIDIKPGAIVRSVVAPRDKVVRLLVDLGATGSGVSVSEGQALRLTSSVAVGTKSLGPDIKAALQNLQKTGAPIFEEVTRVIKFFETRVMPGAKIEEIILTGGGSNIVGVAEFFEKTVGVPTRLGNPFELVDHDHFPISPDVARTFADAVGLAMRGIHA